MNRFALKEKAIIASFKKVFIDSKLAFNPHENGFSRWIDDWVCFPKDRRVMLIFSNWVEQPESKLFDIGRVYSLELLNSGYSPSTIMAYVQYAFRALEVLGKPLGTVEQKDFSYLKQVFKQRNYNQAPAGTFWTWCREKELVAKFLIFPVVKEVRDRSFEEVTERRNRKLISDEQVAAVGVAYNELFSEEGVKKYGFKNYPKEYIAIAFSTLALSTPSRMDIESFCLPEQCVKEHADEEGNKSYSLFWKGSKGHPDNRTHLLNAMEIPVKRVLEVLRLESLPAKILSLFMSDPRLSLNQIMESYPEYHYRLKEYPELDLSKKSSIFHLGLILGFYHEEPIVSIAVNSKTHSSFIVRKLPLSKVSPKDHIIADTSVLPLLVGSIEGDKWFECCDQSKALSHLKPVIFGGKDQSTLEEMTREVVAANKFCNGSVDRIIKGKRTSINISDAMFVYTTAMLRGMNEVKNSNNQKYGLQVRTLPYIYNLLTSDKRPHLERSWIESALKLVGLKSMTFSPHQLRHWMNHHAKESGIPIEIINLWSGRKNAEQAYEYIHTLDEDNAQQITSILSKRKEYEDSIDIKLISIDKIKELSKLPANLMSEGICTQDLVTMPCRFLNDFMLSCFGCEAICYVKGDEKSLKMLEMDLSYQRSRLSEVKLAPGFDVRKASQEWYKVHFDNVTVLSSLVAILKDDRVKLGSSIRVIRTSKAQIKFKVQDSDSGVVTVIRHNLEDSAQSLMNVVESDSKKPISSNTRLMTLLGKYGVGDE